MTDEPHFPGQPPIDSYGNGGFRFAGMSHRGSLIILPSGVYGWPAANLDMISADRLDLLASGLGAVEYLVLGLGADISHPPENIRNLCTQSNVKLEAMATGPAVRTYNILLAEGRLVAAALLAVEDAIRR